jgi:hypothetical protein
MEPSDMPDPKRSAKVRNAEGRLTSESLAALIVDALIDAKIIDREHLRSAIQIAAVEIEVRKALGDY